MTTMRNTTEPDLNTLKQTLKCFLTDVLFEIQSPSLCDMIVESIKEVIKVWDPRVETDRLHVGGKINEHTSTYHIDVYFTMEGLARPITLELLFGQVK